MINKIVSFGAGRLMVYTQQSQLTMRSFLALTACSKDNTFGKQKQKGSTNSSHGFWFSARYLPQTR